MNEALIHHFRELVLGCLLCGGGFLAQFADFAHTALSWLTLISGAVVGVHAVYRIIREGRTEVEEVPHPEEEQHHHE